jgi:hypothetical protein
VKHLRDYCGLQREFVSGGNTDPTANHNDALLLAFALNKERFAGKVLFSPLTCP